MSEWKEIWEIPSNGAVLHVFLQPGFIYHAAVVSTTLYEKPEIKLGYNNKGWIKENKLLLIRDWFE